MSTAPAPSAGLPVTHLDEREPPGDLCEARVSWLTVEQAAAALEVSHTVIRRLIAAGTVPATQVVPRAPRIIARESLSLPDVQAAVEAVHAGRQLRKPTPGQQEFPWK